jgi:hypothetical protein
MNGRHALYVTCAAAMLAAVVAIAADPTAPDAASVASAHKVIAYYFHGDQRCRTCLHIERTAEKVLRDRFAKQFETGRLEWRTVNTDDPVNEHFVRDFQLVSSSLVLVELAGQVPVRHEVLSNVWLLAHDDVKFQEYVGRQTDAFLGGAGG